MRIITGQYKHRKLLGPEGLDTRPITDRVKTAVFDVLAGWMDGSVVLDLFAGTGSLGLEALSRGARLVCFAERDRSALDRLNRNIDTLGVADRCRVWPGDIVKGLAGRLAELDRTIDVAFVDPPYALPAGWDWSEATDRLFEPLAGRLAPDGVVAFRCPRNMPLPEAFGPLCVRARRDYGTMSVVMLTRKDVECDGEPPSSGEG